MDDPRAAVQKIIGELLDDWARSDPEPPESWENWTIPHFLGAMSAWLEVYERAFANNGRPLPADGWEVFGAALRMGAFYE